MTKIPNTPASPRQVRYGSNADGSVNVEEHEIIREIVERVAVNEESPTAVAEDLNSRGVATKRGGLWRASTITKIVEDNKIKVAPGVWMPPPTAKPLPSLTKDLEFNWIEEDIDPRTGEVLGHVARGLDLKGDASEELKAEALAVRRLTLGERADEVTFKGPFCLAHLQSFPGPQSITYESLNDIVKEMTKHTGRKLETLIDQIKGQPDVRGMIRRDVHRLLGEVARQRQVNLGLLEEQRELKRQLAAHTRNIQNSQPSQQVTDAAANQPQLLQKEVRHESLRTALTLGRPPAPKQD